MKTYLVCALLCICCSDIHAQKVFTACDVSFSCKFLHRHLTPLESFHPDAPMTGEARVTVDIADAKPSILNIAIKSRGFDESIELNTLKNLKLLTYLQDTSNYTITFIYSYDPSITNTFGRILGDTIIITARDFPLYSNCHFNTFGDIDSQLIEGKQALTYTVQRTLQTGAYLHSPSAILVERVLDSNRDLVVLRKNNYPELATEIMDDAQNAHKQNFKDELQRYMRNIKFVSSLPVKYFIRYHLHREICGENQNR